MISESSLKQLEQILKKGKPFIVKTNATRRDLDAVNPTAQNNAEVLAALIRELQNKGII